MASENDRRPITLEGCLEHLNASTFRLRPADYTTKYPKWPGAVGIEVEMLPVDKQAKGDSRGELFPALIPLQGPVGSLAASLETLAKRRAWKPEHSQFKGESILSWVELDAGDKLSFEPGGQLEFSSIPYPCLSEAARRTRAVQEIIDGHLREQGLELVQIGINPWYSVDGIGLQMRKPRYQAMNDYFASIGPFGQRMMRQTCTVQVNLDFGPTETLMAQRYLASQLLAPVAGAIFAYSGFVDGHRLSRPGFRSEVWLNLDPTRTGVPPNLARVVRDMDKKSCVDTYADLLMNSRVVFVAALGYKVPAKPVTWAEWLANPIDGVSPTQEDLDTQLSLLFPEVRARGFLELRSVDCQSRLWQLVPAAFYTGLLYDTKSLEDVIELLTPELPRLGDLLKKVPQGLRDADLARLAPAVMELAMAGFSRLATCFKGEGAERDLAVFNERFTARGRSPGDDLQDAVKAGDAAPTLEQIRRLEAEWHTLL